MKYRPYPKYKPNDIEWLGDIPDHWQVKRLKYCATINDETLPETTDPSFEFSYVDIGSVDAMRGIVALEGMEFENAPSRARRIVRDGDTIVSTVRTYLRAIAPIRKPKENLVVSTGFAVVRPRNVDPNFLSYALRDSRFVETVVAYSVGVSYPAVNTSDVSTIPVPLPSTPEQRAIAEFLDAETAMLDKLVGKKLKLIEKLREKRTALISHTVTRGLPPEAARAAGLNLHPNLKPSGIEWLGNILEHWEVKPLKLVARVGNGSTPNRDNLDYWSDGSYPWLNSSVVNLEEVREASDFVTQRALAECHLPRIQPPAVLVGITGEGKTRGMATTLRIEATINQHLAFLKPNETTCDVSYLRRVLDRSYQFLRNESDGGGSTKGAITCEQLGNLRISVPPIAEQRAIADYLDHETTKIDRMVEKVEAAIERLQEYRSALITAAVTGKIDVRGHE